MRKGIWKELDAPAVKVDPYRRELQRSYLKAVDTKINPPDRAAAPALPQGLPEGFQLPRTITSGDEKPMYRTELRTAGRLDHGGDGEDDGSRDQSAPGSQPRRDRQDPGSQICAGRSCRSCRDSAAVAARAA